MKGAAKTLPTREFLGTDAEEEFDSPETVAALADTLRALGHEVELLGDGEPMLRKLLDGPRPELVFNIAEGLGVSRTRESRVPAVLEMLGIPYTGSDPLTLAATLDKECAKRLVDHAGIATPGWALVEEGDLAAVEERLSRLVWPLFVKPNYEGSSKGVLRSGIVRNRAELEAAIARLTPVYHQPLLVEEFVEGEELTVGVVGNRPPEVLGIMRIVPKRPGEGPFIYGIEVKREWEQNLEYESPAKISQQDAETVRRAALACWRALGCRDVARFDFRLRDGVPYFLEVNPLPGLSPFSGDIVFLARGVGINHQELLRRILEAAIARYKR
ncbi:MAG TPA: ATP-grasp domain-containing protein [Pirellulales bacterium]|nr:ATP-grasp domain-containing protein [Pirellulales bacterium]